MAADLGPFTVARTDPVDARGHAAEVDERLSNCPARRGRRRRHTFDHRCRLGPPSIAANAVERAFSRKTTFSTTIAGADPPTPWVWSCKAKVGDGEIDLGDPSILEHVDLEKQNGISLATRKEVRASTGAQHEQWRTAMQAEVQSLVDNHTFEEVGWGRA